MKYKGIVLKEGKDSKAELLVYVEVTEEACGEQELEEYMEELNESILEVFAEYPEEIYTELVYKKLLDVRCDAFTFDLNGVMLLTDICRIVLMLVPSDVKVGVGVHVDGEEWFMEEDVVTLDEFLDNIEY